MMRVNDLAKTCFRESDGLFAPDIQHARNAAQLLAQALFEQVSLVHVERTAEAALITWGYSDAHAARELAKMRALFAPWFDEWIHTK